MSQTVSSESDILILIAEYSEYIRRLRNKWLAQNRPTLRDAHEVMSTQDRGKVSGTITRWGKYVTPLAEAWWRERGFGINWPDDTSKPAQIYKLP